MTRTEKFKVAGAVVIGFAILYAVNFSIFTAAKQAKLTEGQTGIMIAALAVWVVGSAISDVAKALNRIADEMKLKRQGKTY